jgi:hypothetical protein
MLKFLYETARFGGTGKFETIDHNYYCVNSIRIRMKHFHFETDNPTMRIGRL